MLKEISEDSLPIAIFDLLKKETLSKKETRKVKKVSKNISDALRSKQLKVESWRESRRLRAQVRITIYDNILWLPMEPYPDDEIDKILSVIYQHIFTTNV